MIILALCVNGEKLFFTGIYLPADAGIGTHEIQGDLVGGGDLKELFQTEDSPRSLPFQPLQVYYTHLRLVGMNSL